MRWIKDALFGTAAVLWLVVVPVVLVALMVVAWRGMATSATRTPSATGAPPSYCWPASRRAWRTSRDGRYGARPGCCAEEGDGRDDGLASITA